MRVSISGRRLLVWTARRYILEEGLATSRLKDAAAEFPRPHEVLVEVGKLSLMQKAELLYNHAKHANLSVGHRNLIRTHALEIASHPNFSPLRISQLTSVVLKPSSEDPKASPNLSWDEVRDFLNNPGDRWVQAFRALSQSEQTLLLAMLDFEGPTATRDLRASYEMRVSKREGGHLSFEECVARLDHSFLTVTLSHSGKQYVSVQHPSLRDMLLLNLREDIDARRRYISLANPFGLAGMIGGIAELSESENVPQHSVTPADQAEFDIFLSRLRGVSQGVLTLAEWELLLTASERLIPQKPETSNRFTPAMLEFWRLTGEEPPADRVEPVDLDLEAFAGSWKGQIICAVLDGFSSRRTLENSLRFGDDAWTRLLRRFYGLTAYLSPPIYPSFTAILCSDLSKSQDSIRLANLIRSAEPLVARQAIPRALVEEWKDELEAEVIELKRQGETFGSDDNANEFDEWRFRSKKLVETASDFGQWGSLEPIGAICDLEGVFETAKRPREEEPEEENDQELPDSSPYWTVQRLFEDL